MIDSDLDHLLNHARVPAPIPALGAQARFYLLMDACLGHARVGRGRARDYPYSSLQQCSLHMSSTLSECCATYQPGTHKRAFTYDLLSYFYALDAIIASGRAGPGTPLDFDALVLLLLTGLPLKLPVEEWAERFGVRGTSYAMAMRLLKTNELKLLRDDAKRLAILSRHPEPAASIQEFVEKAIPHYGLSTQSSTSLDSGFIRFWRIKPKFVQRHLESTTSPGLQRGASTFYSLVLARLRDRLAEQDSVRIHTDCDSVISILAGRNFEIDFVHAVNELADGGRVIAAWLPRVRPYLEQARLEGHCLTSALPEFSCQSPPPVSLLDLARSPPDHAQASSWPEVLWCRQVARAAHQAPCSGVRGDAAFDAPAFRVPEWHNAMKSEQRYGWSATVFSLADLAERAAIRDSLRKRIRETEGRDFRIPDSTTELQQAVGTGTDGLSFVKLDGDQIGRAFASRAALQQPALSQRMTLLVQERWLNAIVAVMREHSMDCIPIDPIYFRGDDLLFAMPTGLVDSFLRHFSQPRNAPTGSLEVNFSFVVAAFVFEKSDRDRDYAEWDSTLMLHCIPHWLDAAKHVRKGLRAFAPDDFRRIAKEKGLASGIAVSYSSYQGNGGVFVTREQA